MPNHSLTPLNTMPQTGPVDVCTVVPAAQAGAAAAELVDKATTTANIAPPSQACRYIDFVTASSPRVSTSGHAGSVAEQKHSCRARCSNASGSLDRSGCQVEMHSRPASERLLA